MKVGIDSQIKNCNIIMSSRCRNKRRGAEWPQLNLPSEGIHTENGHLFHHETPQPFNDAHKQRLLDC
ncbi:hypothetical protein KIN20_024368, partial [Parelaphostrongylus tenuis]